MNNSDIFKAAVMFNTFLLVSIYTNSYFSFLMGVIFHQALELSTLIFSYKFDKKEEE